MTKTAFPAGAADATQVANDGIETLSRVLDAYQRNLQAAMFGANLAKVGLNHMQRQMELANTWSRAATAVSIATSEYLRGFMQDAAEDWQNAARVGAENVAHQTARVMENARAKAP